MGQIKTLVGYAGFDAAEGSIEARLLSRDLDTMAGDVARMLLDNRITPSELRRLHRHARLLADKARAAERAADLGSSASNKCDVAEGRLKALLGRMTGDVAAWLREALYKRADAATGDHRAERAAGVLILDDYRKSSRAPAENRSATDGGDGSAA